MELPQRRQRLDTNRSNRVSPRARCGAVVIASLAAARRRQAGWNHATDAGQMIVVRPNVLNNMFRFCTIENLMFLIDL
jgi:hypothetical protein